MFGFGVDYDAGALSAAVLRSTGEPGKASRISRGGAWRFIAHANAEIAEAQSKTAGLEKQAAEARLEQERLKQAVGWRLLSKEADD